MEARELEEDHLGLAVRIRALVAGLLGRVEESLDQQAVHRGYDLKIQIFVAGLPG